MALPAKVVFDRYFQEVERRPEERRHYWGKQDLARLRPQVAVFLIDVQTALKEMEESRPNQHETRLG